MLKISAISNYQCHLGEGPVWDWRKQVLWWVDSLGPTLYQFDFVSTTTRLWQLPGRTIGSLAIRENGGLILAKDKGFYTFSPENGETELIAAPLRQTYGLRFNDGKVDPDGNFIAGAMNIDHRQNQNCSMFKLSTDFKVTTILDGFRCFNGPCFSPDNKKIYLTGRQDGAIEVFDYDKQQTLTDGTTLIDNCNPDGATVDAEGYIWSAQWSEQCIIRISPHGKLDTRISIPNQIVSSVMFGGPDLDLIFVTTVGGQVGDDIPVGKDSGKTLVIENSGYRGLPEYYYRGMGNYSK